MRILTLLTVISGFSTQLLAAPYPKNNATHSEPFYLVAIPNGGVSARLEAGSFLPVVYDEYYNIVVDAGINSKTNQVGGVVNLDLSVSVSGLNGTFLKVGDKLEFTAKRFKSAGHFTIEDGDLTYDGESSWVVCHSIKDVLVPKSLSPDYCDATTDIVLRPYSYNADAGIPDFPSN